MPVLPITFTGGMDDTHNPRALPADTGVICRDIDLRQGRFEPRRSLRALSDPNAFKPPCNLFAVLPSTSGDEVLLVATGFDDAVGRLKVVRFNWVGKNSINISAVDVVRDRDSGYEAWVQKDEPMELAKFGDFVYIPGCHAPTAAFPAESWKTYELSLVDFRAKKMAWPLARRICNYLGYVVLGDMPAYGAKHLMASDLPYVAEDPTFDDGNEDDVPGDPDDRVMKLVPFRDGLYVFLKRSLHVYWGPPTSWQREQVLDIGTLSPESVQVIGPYIYFLGHDGIPYRTDGTQRMAERVGAFDHEGKLKHMDGRSPIEAGLRAYVLKATYGDYVDSRWDSKVSFEDECNLDDDVEVVGNAVQPERSADGFCTEEYTGISGNRWRKLTYDGAGTPPVQTWRVPVSGDTGEAGYYRAYNSGTDDVVAHSRVLNSVLVYLLAGDAADVGTHILRCRIIQDWDGVEVARADSTIDFLFEDVATEALFEFDAVPLVDASESSHSQRTYRIELTSVQSPIGGSPPVWLGEDASPPQLYPRGTFTGGASASSPAPTSGWFRVQMGYYKNGSVFLLPDYQPVLGVGQRWGGLFIVQQVPEHASVGWQVRANASGSWVNVVPGQPLSTVLSGSPGEKAQWRARLHGGALAGYGASFPTLQSVTITRLSSHDSENAPTSLHWDGRYLLNLARKDVSPLARDTYVWDREAWSKWLLPGVTGGGGIVRADVAADDDEEPRLVFVDAALVTDCYKPYLMRTDYGSWRQARPAFQTGSLRMAQGLAAQIRSIFTEHSDLGVAGQLFVYFSVDDDNDWAESNVALIGDRRDHSTDTPSAQREGRNVIVAVGLDKSVSAAEQVPVAVDAVVLDIEPIGRRYGHHEGGV